MSTESDEIERLGRLLKSNEQESKRDIAQAVVLIAKLSLHLSEVAVGLKNAIYSDSPEESKSGMQKVLDAYRSSLCTLTDASIFLKHLKEKVSE